MTLAKKSKSDKSAQLILWRHADAEEGIVDSARQLTARGRKQASRMARWLDERLPGHYRLIVSPAVRAQQTASALNAKFQTEPGLSVDTDTQKILRAINWPELGGTTVLVGHQPSLGYLAAFLTSGREQPWNIRKGAIWWLQRQGSGIVLRTVLDPSLI